MNWRSRVLIVVLMFAIFLVIPTAVQAQVEGRAWRSWLHRLSGPGTQGVAGSLAFCLNRVDRTVDVRKLCPDHPEMVAEDASGDTLPFLKRTGFYVRGTYAQSHGEGELANDVEFTQKFVEGAIKFGLDGPHKDTAGFLSRFHLSCRSRRGRPFLLGPGSRLRSALVRA